MKQLTVNFEKTSYEDVLEDELCVEIKGKFSTKEITHLAFLFQMWGGDYKVKSKT